LGIRAFGALLLFLFSSSVSWGDTFFELNTRWDKSQVTLGDEITVTIDVVRDKNYRLLPLPDEPNFPPFEIKSIEYFGPEDRGSAVREGYRMVLTVFELGMFKIPKFAVSFTDDKGNPGQVLTEEIRIEVLPVERRGDDTQDIRGIKKPIKFHPNLDPATLLKFGLPAFLLFLVLIYLIRRILIRRASDAEKLLSPIERVTLALDRLEKKSISEPGEARTYFDTLSVCMRQYFLDEFDAGSTDQTTRQYLEIMAGKGFASGTVEGLKQILELSDYVKFADYVPASSDARAMIPVARKVVELNPPRASDSETEKTKNNKETVA